MPIRRVFHVKYGLVVIVVCGLAAGLAGGRAFAADRDSQSSGGFFDNLFETLNLKTRVGPTPDFVEATHPDPSTLHFIPTGTPHPKRKTPVKSSSDIAAAKAALDAAHDAQLQPAPPPPPATAPRPGTRKPRATAAEN